MIKMFNLLTAGTQQEESCKGPIVVQNVRPPSSEASADLHGGGLIYNLADPEIDLYRQGFPPSPLSLLQTAHSVGWADTSALLSLDPPGEDSIKKISRILLEAGA